MNIDELLYIREQARINRDWKKSDEIRMLLESELVFVFDATWGQETFYLTERYFAKKPEAMTNREYLITRIKADARAEANFNAWLYSQSKSGLTDKKTTSEYGMDKR